ncbi:caspase domain-containing protein [Roridomyces roridus]|uniref:Caspase domain-containing protein n=1 Tax=Roridomyces roridus TaxID=1738132 RepID=A0AAD7AX05_9AGAR|nr:caspase domain-containing protein [Roridomyces roridus]
MKWSFSGGNGNAPPRSSRKDTLSVLHKVRRPLSTPGPPSPGLSVSRPHSPVPVPVSESNSAPSPLQPQPGQHHRRPPSPHHAAPQPIPHRRHHHAHTPSPSPAFIRVPTPHFTYSKITGRKRALCIGINYGGQSNELRGCINDAKNVFTFLVRRGGYHPEDIVVLTDDSPIPRGKPTRQNIIDAMHWLVDDARPHDAMFFHYAGHGGQTPDLDGDELDGYDETIYPVDYKLAGHIVDDEMHDIMVKPLPAGCRLTAIFDSCHSGTALDLPFMYDPGPFKNVPVTGGSPVRKKADADFASLSGRRDGQTSADTLADGMFISIATHVKPPPEGCRLTGAFEFCQPGPVLVTDRAVTRKMSPADVISISGCQDGQTSADTFVDGKFIGAASHAFITAFEMHPHQSYQELMRNVHAILKTKFSQKPQLASSHPIDTNLKFII